MPPSYLQSESRTWILTNHVSLWRLLWIYHQCNFTLVIWDKTLSTNQFLLENKQPVSKVKSHLCLWLYSKQADRLKKLVILLKHALLYSLVFLGYSSHLAPSICMSAFSIKVQQHNEDTQMNTSVSKSILPPTCSSCY